MGRTAQDFIVTGFGLITSLLTAYLLAVAQVHLHFALYALTFWFVIPIGAILCGYLAASGYYIGTRLFQHRPTRLLAFNVVSVSITTFFLLKYLLYKSLVVKGVPVSSLIPFLAFLDLTIRKTVLSFNFMRLGEAGWLGYALAAVQVFGFALGGLNVYKSLAARTYCNRCSHYPKTEFLVERYERSADRVEQTFQKADHMLSLSNTAEAVKAMDDLLTAETGGYQLSLAASRCGHCQDQFVRLVMRYKNEKKWTPVESYNKTWTIARQPSPSIPASQMRESDI